MNKVQRSITAEDAAAERVRREKARRHLMPFAKYLWNGYIQARHLTLVAEKLEEVERYIRTRGQEGIGRLMVFMPPRMGKTELTAKIFPSWFLGRNPDKRVIITAYGADLAQASSRAIRNYVMDPNYSAIFGNLRADSEPVQLSEDSRAKSNWDLAAPHRGGVDSAGVGGAITGKGAHMLVIDDPYKNRDDAESEAYREKVDSWWKSSAYTRLEDGGAIVVVHTRWHPDDLAGMLLKMSVSDPLADQYEVVFLPAVALEEDAYPINERQFQDNLQSGIYIPYKDQLNRKAGQALWPEKYDEINLEKTRVNIGDLEFSALHQQVPRPMSGGFFGVSDFGIVDAPPEGLRWVRYVDLALSDKKTADFNASVAMGMDKEGTVYLRDMARVRGWNEFRTRLGALMVSDMEQGTQWGIEDVAFQALAFQELLRDPKLANAAIRAIRPRGDKVERARPLQTRALAGKVKLVRGSWNREFILEALDFPKGRHDDQIDTASGGLQMIAGMDRKRGARMYSWTTTI